MTFWSFWMLLRGAGGDELAVVETVDLVGDVHDQVHVVLHDEHGHAGVADRGDARDQVLALARVRARGRLVEQQQPRLRGQSAGDLYQALLAVGQAGRRKHRPGPCSPTRASASIARDAGPLLLPPLRREAQATGPEARLLVPVAAHQHVVEHAHVHEDAQVLEGAGHAQTRGRGGVELGQLRRRRTRCGRPPSSAAG